MLKDETKKIKSARKLLIVVCMAILFGMAFFIAQNNKLQTLRIGSSTFTIEIPKTEKQKANGLCCRDELPADSGMLFVYDKPGNYRFWMKDTRIPLDMIWINSDKEVVHIEKNVQPDSYPQSFSSSMPSQYVLELNAGVTETKGIGVGDRVSF